MKSDDLFVLCVLALMLAFTSLIIYLFSA